MRTSRKARRQRSTMPTPAGLRVEKKGLHHCTKGTGARPSSFARAVVGTIEQRRQLAFVVARFVTAGSSQWQLPGGATEQRCHAGIKCAVFDAARDWERRLRPGHARTKRDCQLRVSRNAVSAEQRYTEKSDACSVGKKKTVHENWSAPCCRNCAISCLLEQT